MKHMPIQINLRTEFTNQKQMGQQPVQVMMNTTNDMKRQIGIMELASIRCFIESAIFRLKFSI